MNNPSQSLDSTRTTSRQLLRTAERRGTLGIIAGTLAALALMAIAGCSGSNAHAVDTSRARDALTTALDAWKRGDSPESVPSMTVQDLDWERGARLIDYQVLGDGQAKDANLSIKAKLTLAADKAATKKVEKTVSYLVGTSPSITVFRDMMKR